MTELTTHAPADVEARMKRAAALADFVEASLAATDPVIPPAGILAGPLRRTELAPPPAGWDWGDDNLHYPMDVGTLLQRGCTGIAATARANAANLAGEQAHYLRCIARTLEAVTAFVAAHARLARDQADSAAGPERQRLHTIAAQCAALAAGPPRTFAQAVQLFWFVHSLRGAYNCSSTIGRLDQHLQPFYKRQLDEGTLTREGALEILCELWRGLNAVVDHPGMGLMNLVVGGQDAQGNDATNDMSYLLIDTAIRVNDTNPFLSARLHARTPPAFVDKIVELQLVGHGQGTIYNDEAIIPSLVAYGVPVELARLYANDGCNEVTIDGRSTISLWIVDALRCIDATLFNGQANPSAQQEPRRVLRASEGAGNHGDPLDFGFATGDFADMTSFDQFLEAYLRQYWRRIEMLLANQTGHLQAAARTGVTTLLTAGTFGTVLATGLDPHRGGVDLVEQMIFLGSLGTVADCLAAVRKVVFDEKACTPAQLREALSANWVGHEALRQRCLGAPKFGNDDDYVDLLIADVIRRTVEHVRSQPSASGLPIWPCLFNHSYVATAQACGATPDGRRWMDPVGEHFSPTPGRALRGPTAIIRSAAKSPLADCVGVAIFHLALDRRSLLSDSSGRLRLRGLIQSALRLGVTQMNTALYDVDALKDAKLHPDRHADLIVRVWGFSARFVSLSPDMQDHIIARAAGG
ncbi:MAG: hypothetical protein NTV86_17255 [Planctomycetota bacterium]|nr:hypothetical protein [Planctomycetota bacterium]